MKNASKMFTHWASSTARDLHRAHTTNRKIKPPNAKTLLFLYTKRKFKNLHLKYDIYYDHIFYLRNHISSIIISRLPSHKYLPKMPVKSNEYFLLVNKTRHIIFTIIIRWLFMFPKHTHFKIHLECHERGPIKALRTPIFDSIFSRAVVAVPSART